MAHDARGAVAALRRSHDELAAFVGDLGPDGLRRPSACADWSVAQVLSHLGSAAEIGLATLASGRADQDLAQGVWARWDAMDPDEQAASSVAADRRYVEAWEALDEGALTSRTVELGFLPEPVGLPFFASMRLSEVGLHRWDLEVMADPGATVTPDAVPYALDVLVGFAGFFARPPGPTGRVAVRTTDPEGRYLLTVGDAEVTLTGDAADAPGHLRLPAESLVRLIAGRLGPEHTPASVDADGALTLDDLRRCFPGY